MTKAEVWGSLDYILHQIDQGTGQWNLLAHYGRESDPDKLNQTDMVYLPQQLLQNHLQKPILDLSVSQRTLLNP